MRLEKSDFRFEKANLIKLSPHRATLRPKRAGNMLERADFGTERADLWLERADSESARARLWLVRPGGDVHTYG